MEPLVVEYLSIHLLFLFRPDGVPLRPVNNPILSDQVGVNTAMVVVLIEHVRVGFRVGEGEMSEHLVVKSPCVALTDWVRAVPGIVGYDGSTMEVGREHEGILENPVHQSPGFWLRPV